MARALMFVSEKGNILPEKWTVYQIWGRGLHPSSNLRAMSLIILTWQMY